MKPTFTIGAFAIILDDQNRILLCHRLDYDLWNLPGGTMEYNESPWECVIREVKEEVGLDVEIERLAEINTKKNQNDIVFTFICKIKSGELTLSDEADQIEYFSVDKIPENTSQSQVERIKDIINSTDDKLILKTQNQPSSIEFLKRIGKIK